MYLGFLSECDQLVVSLTKLNKIANLGFFPIDRLMTICWEMSSLI